MNRLNVNDARREALFASGLQRTDTLTAQAVEEAIRVTVRQFGAGGCAGVMAREFGDHPEAAAERMRWICQLLAQAPARPQPGRRPLAVPRPRRCPVLTMGERADGQV
jgi:hypothetical protein